MFVGALFLHLLSLCFDSDVGYNLAVNPILLGTLAAAGGSLVNGVVNHMMSSHDARLQNKYTKELMDYQWDKFSSPKAQAAGLAEAGLNPSVVFGQGSISHTATPSAQSAPISPFDFGLSGSDMAAAVQSLATAKNLNLDSVAKAIENDVLDKTKSDRINKFAIDNNLSKQQIAKLEKEIGNIEGLNTQIQEQINLLRSQKKMQDLENDAFKTKLDAELRSYADKHKIDEQTLSQMVEQAPVILDKLKNEQKLLDIDAALAGDYKDTQTKLGVVGNILNVLTQLLNVAKR